jgi:hypothetical protein
LIKEFDGRLKKRIEAGKYACAHLEELPGAAKMEMGEL